MSQSVGDTAQVQPARGGKEASSDDTEVGHGSPEMGAAVGTDSSTDSWDSDNDDVDDPVYDRFQLKFCPLCSAIRMRGRDCNCHQLAAVPTEAPISREECDLPSPRGQSSLAQQGGCGFKRPLSAKLTGGSREKYVAVRVTVDKLPCSESKADGLPQKNLPLNS
jgi:hypothetical protein